MAVVIEKEKPLSPTQRKIQEHLQKIEQLKKEGLEKDIADVLQRKHDREDLYVVCKAFTADFETGMRKANAEKARASRGKKDKTEEEGPKQ